MTHPRLVIFARYPVPGSTKTRLIPAIGAMEAARLQDAMTRHVLGQADALSARRAVEVEVRSTGSTAAAMRERYGGRRAYVAQGVGDLGTRLSCAAAEATGSGDPVVIVGSDCPDLTADVLAQAFDALAAHDVVLGPATDGGYYLIGLRRNAPELFDPIAWSTDRVLRQTLDVVKRRGLRCLLLPMLCDVDVPADLPAAERLRSFQPIEYHPSRLAMTGATGTLGLHFLRRVLDHWPNAQVTALVRFDSQSLHTPAFRRLMDRHEKRLTLLDGDVRRLRLSAGQRRQLIETDGGLWHFAASTVLGATAAAHRALVHHVNDAGTGELLRLAGSSDRPGPFYHLSTAYVCGRRAGVVNEHELLVPDDGFRNEYERSKHAAERRVRAAFEGGLTGAIFRPGFVVAQTPAPAPGDLVGLLLRAIGVGACADQPITLRIPITAGISAVPIDWVTRTLLSLAAFRCGRTYHLTAPHDVTMAKLVAAAHAAGVVLRLHPAARRASLSTIERRFDRKLAPFQPYYDTHLRFDRRNLELDTPSLAEAPEIGLPSMLRQALPHRDWCGIDAACLEAGDRADRGPGIRTC